MARGNLAKAWANGNAVATGGGDWPRAGNKSDESGSSNNSATALRRLRNLAVILKSESVCHLAAAGREAGGSAIGRLARSSGSRRTAKTDEK
jgi:hypothetical protein